MKVQASWGPKDTSGNYTLQAKDLEQALAELNQRKEWGEFTWRMDYRWDGNTPILEPSFKIIMPKWPAYADQKQTCKDAWDSMWKALSKHEDGHREILEKLFSKLVADLEALPDSEAKKADGLIAATLKSMKADQVTYDTQTDHGKSRGVELVVAPECRTQTEEGDS